MVFTCLPTVFILGFMWFLHFLSILQLRNCNAATLFCILSYATISLSPLPSLELTIDLLSRLHPWYLRGDGLRGWLCSSRNLWQTLNASRFGSALSARPQFGNKHKFRFRFLISLRQPNLMLWENTRGFPFYFSGACVRLFDIRLVPQLGNKLKFSFRCLISLRQPKLML